VRPVFQHCADVVYQLIGVQSVLASDRLAVGVEEDDVEIRSVLNILHSHLALEVLSADVEF